MKTRGARSRLLAVLLAVCAVGSTAAGVGASVVAAGQIAGSGGRTSWIDLARTLSGLVPPSLLELLDGPSAISDGRDGRLTILLLGSDSRRGGVGRTDTIMVFSVKGNSISAVSIPRDMARIPNPDGGTYSARVNALFRQLGANQFVRVMENLLQIEIDYYALTTFFGFHALVDEIDPVPIRTRQVRDTQYQDDPNLPKGVYFPAQDGYELHAYQPGPRPLCNGLWKTQGTGQANWCRRAMPYVRSRKGSSDFARARRQQDFVIAAIRRVLKRGSGSALNSLLKASQGMEGSRQLITNIPLNASSAQDLFRRLDGASVAMQEVLAPTKYATHIPGGTGYELNLPQVRALMRQWFGSTGSPPPPQPTPTRGPTPTAGPTATPRRTATPAPTLPRPATPTPARPTPTLAPARTPPPTPTVAPGQTPQPTPTQAPGQTALPTATLAPGQTPLPTPTLAPSQTPLPTPTPAPGQTPLPTATLPPGQTPSPTAVGALPSGATAEPGVPGAPVEPGATASPGGAVAPTSGPSSPDPSQAQTSNDMVLFVAALAVALLAAGALFLGYRRIRTAR